MGKEEKPKQKKASEFTFSLVNGWIIRTHGEGGEAVKTRQINIEDHQQVLEYIKWLDEELWAVRRRYSRLESEHKELLAGLHLLLNKGTN